MTTTPAADREPGGSGGSTGAYGWRQWIGWIIGPAALPPPQGLGPEVLFPVLGLGDIRKSAAPYANPIIFLFRRNRRLVRGFRRAAPRAPGS